MEVTLHSDFKRICLTVQHELENKYLLKVRVFFDGDFAAAWSAVQSPNLIILDLKNIPDMAVGIQALCHEYCHLLREKESAVDSQIRAIHNFYLKQCREFYDHDLTTQGYLVYYYSLLELDARAFGESYGTVYTDHYFSKLSASDLLEAYTRNGAEELVKIIRQVYDC